MKKTTDDLIQVLTEKHTKRAYWRRPHVLLSIWMGINLIYFAMTIIRFPDLVLNSSYLALGLEAGCAILGWILFTKSLNNPKSSNLNLALFLGIVIGTLSLVFSFDHSVQHERALSVTSGDWSCFTHTVMSALVPVVLFGALMKNFFVTNTKATLSFFTVYLSMIAVMSMELKCHDREFWHMIFGHQSSVLGIFVLILGAYLLKKKLASAAP